MFFGDNGCVEVFYEIDVFYDELGIVVEVEVGWGVMGNVDYCDIICMFLLFDVEYMVLMMLLMYCYGFISMSVFVWICD